MYHVLTEKCTGEAFEKVMSCDPGCGFMAYQRIYAWYASSSGLAIQERLKAAMNPGVPKKEEEISGVLENWVSELRYLENHGKQYALPEEFKILGLRLIMTIKPDLYDQMLKSRLDISDAESRFKAILEDIRDFANRRRLESNLKRVRDMPTPMDVGTAGESGTSGL